MSKHNRPLNVQPIKCLLEQICLCFRGPNDVSGPQAMSKSRTVEHDYPVILGREINQTARLEILDHAAIAVKKNQRPAVAAFHIVQTNPSTSMNRPRGGLSRCAFLAKCRFTTAVAATRVAAPAMAVIAGYRLKAARQSDKNEEDRVCRRAMCNTSAGLHDASGK
jgi:hypothetical protein